MIDDYQERLLHAHFDDVLTDAERAEFAALVRASEAARRRFWELAEVHGLVRDAAQIAWPDDDASAVVPLAAQAPSPAAAHWYAWPRLGPVAAGLLLGVLTTGLASAIVRPADAPVHVLLQEDFESAVGPRVDGVPTTADVWSGDFAAVVAAQAGITPVAGTQMLRFLRADYQDKPNAGGYIGETYRLLDVRDRRGELAAGDAVVQLSAQFNAAPHAGEKYVASLSLFALDAAALTDGTLRSGAVLLDRAQAVTRRSNLVLDHDPATWQKLSADLRLPPGVDYLLVRVAVAHAGPTKDVAFAAHYADDVRVVLARRPFLP